MKYLRVFDKENDTSNLEAIWYALFSSVDHHLITLSQIHYGLNETKDKCYFDVWAHEKTEEEQEQVLKQAKLLVEMNKQIRVEEKEK